MSAKENQHFFFRRHKAIYNPNREHNVLCRDDQIEAHGFFRIPGNRNSAFFRVIEIVAAICVRADLHHQPAAGVLEEVLDLHHQPATGNRGAQIFTINRLQTRVF